MSTFQWRGEVYPFPPGFEGLQLDEWFLRFARIQKRLLQVDELDVPPMLGADGHELDPTDVLLSREYGIHSMEQFAAFRNWSVHSWAHHVGEEPGALVSRMVMKCRDIIMSEQTAAADAPRGAGGEPVSFETFVQLQEAMNAAHQRGGDSSTVLADFGLTAADFGSLGAYWNQKMQAEMMMYHQLYSEYSTKYRALYGGA